MRYGTGGIVPRPVQGWRDGKPLRFATKRSSQDPRLLVGTSLETSPGLPSRRLWVTNNFRMEKLPNCLRYGRTACQPPVSVAGANSAGVDKPDAVTIGFSERRRSGHSIGAAGHRVLKGNTRAVRPFGSYKLGAAGTCGLLPASGSGTGETGGGEAEGAGGGDGFNTGGGAGGAV